MIMMYVRYIHIHVYQRTIRVSVCVAALFSNHNFERRKAATLCLHAAISNPRSSANVKEKAMIRNLSKAGEDGVSISMHNVMWHGQILEPERLQEMLNCKLNMRETRKPFTCYFRGGGSLRSSWR